MDGTLFKLFVLIFISSRFRQESAISFRFYPWWAFRSDSFPECLQIKSTQRRSERDRGRSDRMEIALITFRRFCWRQWRWSSTTLCRLFVRSVFVCKLMSKLIMKFEVPWMPLAGKALPLVRHFKMLIQFAQITVDSERQKQNCSLFRALSVSFLWFAERKIKLNKSDTKKHTTWHKLHLLSFVLSSSIVWQASETCAVIPRRMLTTNKHMTALLAPDTLFFILSPFHFKS